MIPAKQFLRLLKKAANSWVEDYVPSMGAALSYYTLFSIAPLLLIVIAVAGLAFGDEAARGEIFGQLAGLIGEEGAKGVEGLVQAADEPKEGMLSTVIGVVVLIIGATTVFGELQNTLDRIWRAPARETSEGWWNLVRTRLLSFGMILGIAFLLMVSLVLSAALAAVGKWWGPAFAGWQAIAHALEDLRSVGWGDVLFARGCRKVVGPGVRRLAGDRPCAGGPAELRLEHGAVRAHLQVHSSRARRLARRVDRRGGDRAPLRRRQVPHRPIHRQERRRIRL